MNSTSKERYFAIFWPLAIMLTFLPGYDLFDYNDNPFNGKPVAGDYLVFWFAGIEANLGRAIELYDPAQFKNHMAEYFDEGFRAANWLYPPHILFVFAGLAKLSYALSWVVFTVVSVSVYLFAIAKLFPGQPRMLLLCSIAPATFICIVQSQTGFVVSALLIGAFFVLPKRPVLAGLLIGLLTIKPQMGILIPFILLFERKYLTVVVAGITTIALMAVSVLWFGVEVWQQYITAMVQGSSVALLKYNASVPLGTMTTVYGFASAIGISHNIALMAQGLTAVASLVAAFYVSRSAIDNMSKMATYILLSYLVSPYVMSYDFQAASVVAALVICGINRQIYSRPEKLLAISVLILPLIQLASELLFIPVAILFLLSFTSAMVLRCVNFQVDRRQAIPVPLSS